MSSKTTYLITGANRGIGRGLVTTYLARPNTTVIAGVRDPRATAKTLNELPRGQDSDLIIIQIDSSSETDASDAVKLLKLNHNITKLDVVIANAGICKAIKPVVDLSVKEVQEHLWVNTIGPLILFQGVYPLLRNTSQPRFVVVSAIAGSIGGMESNRIPFAAYGMSKAALNYLTCKIHVENPWLIAFPIHPGVVDTDMLVNVTKSMQALHRPNAAPAVGVPNAMPSGKPNGVPNGVPNEVPTSPSNGATNGITNGAPNGAPPTGAPARGPPPAITTQESVDGMVAVIDGSTRQEASGHFMSYDGSILAW